MSDAAYWAEYRKRNREKIAAYHRQYRIRNLEKVLAQHRKWYLNNKDKQKAASKRYRESHKHERNLKRRGSDREKFGYIRRKYGLSKAEFLVLYESQSGRCAVCEKELSYKRLHIDHDHGTGAVRGCLCSNCNVGIGLLGDTEESVQRAVMYLRKGASRGESTSKN